MYLEGLEEDAGPNSAGGSGSKSADPTLWRVDPRGLRPWTTVLAGDKGCPEWLEGGGGTGGGIGGSMSTTPWGE